MLIGAFVSVAENEESVSCVLCKTALDVFLPLAGGKCLEMSVGKAV